jgi:hypothetical protein
MASWAYLKLNTPFSQLFPDLRVSIRSIVPCIPREIGSPPCYVVIDLEEWQVSGLAQILYERWQPECESLEQAAEYIRGGLPLRCDWFDSCGTDEYHQVPWGAAMNIAIRSNYENSTQ